MCWTKAGTLVYAFDDAEPVYPADCDDWVFNFKDNSTFTGLSDYDDLLESFLLINICYAILLSNIFYFII